MLRVGGVDQYRQDTSNLGSSLSLKKASVQKWVRIIEMDGKCVLVAEERQAKERLMVRMEVSECSAVAPLWWREMGEGSECSWLQLVD